MGAVAGRGCPVSAAPHQHTPGPWVAKPDEVSCGSEEICRAPLVVCLDGLGCEAGPRWLSNARLIASAPELLAALESLFATGSIRATTSDASREAIAAARAAIASATGRAAS